MEALYIRISLEIVLPDGQPYSPRAQPDFASAVVDPDTDTIGIWAQIANPDGLLRPGMPVTVLSHIK